jgi:hypothetical protein
MFYSMLDPYLQQIAGISMDAMEIRRIHWTTTAAGRNEFE